MNIKDLIPGKWYRTNWNNKKGFIFEFGKIENNHVYWNISFDENYKICHFYEINKWCNPFEKIEFIEEVYVEEIHPHLPNTHPLFGEEFKPLQYEIY